MKIWRVLTLTMVLLSISVPLVARLTTWLAPAVRAGVSALAAALVLVLYFDWRARLKSRILTGARGEHELATAA